MAPEPTNVQREIGELIATQRAMLTRFEQLEDREDRRDAKIDAIHAWMQQAQGSWKTMVMAGAFGAAVTGVLSNVGAIFAFLRGH